MVLRKIGQPTTCFDHVLADLEDEEEPLTLAVVRPRDTRGQTGPHCAAVMPGTVAVPVDLLDEDTAASLARAVAGQAKLAGLATLPGRTTELASTLAFVRFLGERRLPFPHLLCCALTARHLPPRAPHPLLCCSH